MSFNSLVDGANTIKDTTLQIKNLSQGFDDFGKSLKEGMKAFEKLAGMSSLLGGLGAFVGIIGIFAGGPSDTQLILNAISQLSRQIKDLKSEINYKFDYLEKVVELSNAQSTLIPRLSYFDNLNDYINSLQNSPESSRDYKTARDRLLEYVPNLHLIRENALIIYNCMTGKDGLNFLESTVEKSYGDIRELNRNA
ncbi:MAG: hypothetical protein F6K22_29450 [Okeania sp. SIO2F4]|uniref:hypothetical protein n=1 Tax=Okeania sp. SIO2F4 TaxID=2607790 RepID=UPI00142B2596|nr:hypothetical protein [Okeania sp. SIO2F4]NES06581.1 hypothetical protein [Okeania sp. SIO2F4]